MLIKSVLFLLFLSLCGAHPQYNPNLGEPAPPVKQPIGPYEPKQSDLCELGLDCVHWQRCLDGFVSIDNPLAQSIKPTNFLDLQCGDAEHLCCGIPGGILDILGPQIEDIIEEELGVYPEQLPTSCGHSSYDCVPYFQCKDGVIVSDGEGLIDIRVRPQAVCVNPEYPEVPAVCCLIPGKHPIPDPIEKCPAYQECVDFALCSPDGTINSDGSGLIDIRTGFTSCYLPSGIGGICCTPPPPYVDSCPQNSICTVGHECGGQALDASSNFIDYTTTGLWTHCNYGGGDGVCCIPPPPPFVEYCPEDSVCTSHSDCTGRALDGYNNFVDYISSGIWTECPYQGLTGVCCIPPPPRIIDSCPGNSVCVSALECKGQALDFLESFVDYRSDGSWLRCSNYNDGVCCINPNPYIPATECGVRNANIDERITSNYAPNEASFGEFPWQAIVFYQNYTFNCGASLISHVHVLTGAHCVKHLLPDDLRIRFGEWQVNSFEEPLKYQDKNVLEVHVHPEFNPKNLHNDVAILKLVEPVELQYHINTICLPELGKTYTGQCFTSGWGKDSFEGNFQHILKKIDLPYVQKEYCQTLLRATRLGKYFNLHESFVCAGGELNKDACYGDGGGPLFCLDEFTGRYVQLGITAWGIGCGQEGIPGVYADVQYLRGWIDSVVLGIGQQQQQTVPGYGK